MSELKGLLLLKDGNLYHMRAEEFISNLQWLIDQLNNPPAEYITVQWDDKLGGYNFIASDVDPIAMASKDHPYVQDIEVDGEPMQFVVGTNRETNKPND